MADTSENVIGVDLGGTKILAGVIDAAGTVQRTFEAPTPTDSQAALLDALEAAVRELLTPETRAVGFGIPSWIDRQSGVALGSVNIPLGGLRLEDEMGKRLGLPIGVANDASAAALAEYALGAGRGSLDVLLLTLGTGVGGGVVSDGRLFRGWAELGHFVIVEDGEPCQGSCTGRGHVESYCSGTAADRLAVSLLGPGASSRDLVDQRHPALAQIGRHLGTAIGSLINIFSPEVVVIGGGFGMAAWDQLREPAEAVILREALEPGGREVKLALAELGTSAGLIGAGLVAFEAL